MVFSCTHLHTVVPLPNKTTQKLRKMKTKQLTVTVEVDSEFNNSLADEIRKHLSSTSIETALLVVQNATIGTDLKCGRGGHHVWVSDQNNKRIIIIL